MTGIFFVNDHLFRFLLLLGIKHSPCHRSTNLPSLLWNIRHVSFALIMCSLSWSNQYIIVMLIIWSKLTEVLTFTDLEHFIDSFDQITFNPLHLLSLETTRSKTFYSCYEIDIMSLRRYSPRLETLNETVIVRVSFCPPSCFRSP